MPWNTLVKKIVSLEQTPNPVDGGDKWKWRVNIINTDRSGRPGKHWKVLLWRLVSYQSKNEFIFIDSLSKPSNVGREEQDEAIATLCLMFSYAVHKTIYTGDQIDAYSCGYYSITLAMFLERVINAGKVEQLFDEIVLQVPETEQKKSNQQLFDEMVFRVQETKPEGFNRLVWAILQVDELQRANRTQEVQPKAMGLVDFWTQGLSTGTIPVDAMIRHLCVRFLSPEPVRICVCGWLIDFLHF
jgi:hypothetical protein